MGKMTKKEAEEIKRLHEEGRAGPRVYHIIEPSGNVHSSVWTGELENACIPVSRVRELLSIQHIEHVYVIWKGRPAHLFLDELGYLHELQVNPKATRIYMNATLRREGLHDYLYEDLAASPMFKVVDLQDSIRARILIHAAKMVLGRALLWEGGYE